MSQPPADVAASICPVGGERWLTSGEIKLAKSIFGSAIDYDAVKIHRRKWFLFHPRKVTMAPRGHIHFHPSGTSYCDDFSIQGMALRGHFIHEMVHVWQAQKKGSWWLVFNRMPWATYNYCLKPGWPLEKYGIEQQAEIVKHAFLLRNGIKVAGVSSPDAYQVLVSFPGVESVV